MRKLRIRAREWSIDGNSGENKQTHTQKEQQQQKCESRINLTVSSQIINSKLTPNVWILNTYTKHGEIEMWSSDTFFIHFECRYSLSFERFCKHYTPFNSSYEWQLCTHTHYIYCYIIIGCLRCYYRLLFALSMVPFSLALSLTFSHFRFCHWIFSTWIYLNSKLSNAKCWWLRKESTKQQQQQQKNLAKWKKTDTNEL